MSMTELGVLALLILVMVAAIFLLRKAPGVIEERAGEDQSIKA